MVRGTNGVTVPFSGMLLVSTVMSASSWYLTWMVPLPLPVFTVTV